MPDAPEQFRVGPVLTRFQWEEKPGLNAVENVTAWGAEVETLVHPYLSFRFGLELGTSEIRSGLDRTSADQYVVELLADLRLPVGRLGRMRLVPFVTGGYGSVVHAPQGRDDLITKNQSAYVLGGGAEYSGLPHATVRAEWRRARVEFNDIFDPDDRSSSMRDMSRWILGVFWRF